MNPNKYLEDITEIKKMMNRSSRFISLSGLSGVLAGIYALIGAYFAKKTLVEHSAMDAAAYSQRNSMPLQDNLTLNLAFIASCVVIAAMLTGIILSIRKAKKSDESIWNKVSRRLVFHFFMPLFAGGIFCIALIQNGSSGLVASATLLFYGLACVNASKYTLGDVKYMGLAFIILSLVSTQFLGYGLYFWALGFGLFHIIYGGLMYFKYERS